MATIQEAVDKGYLKAKIVRPSHVLRESILVPDDVILYQNEKGWIGYKNSAGATSFKDAKSQGWDWFGWIYYEGKWAEIVEYRDSFRKEKLLEEVRGKYPIDTVFCNKNLGMNNNKHNTIIGRDFYFISDNEIKIKSSSVRASNCDWTVYKDGKWADIIPTASLDTLLEEAKKKYPVGTVINNGNVISSVDKPNITIERQQFKISFNRIMYDSPSTCWTLYEEGKWADIITVTPAPVPEVKLYWKDFIGHEVEALVDYPSGGHVKKGNKGIIKAINTIDFYTQKNYCVPSDVDTKRYVILDKPAPEKWCVKITPENKKVLKTWWLAQDRKDDFSFDGWVLSDKGYDGTGLWYGAYPKESYKEITFEEFKKTHPFVEAVTEIKATQAERVNGTNPPNHMVKDELDPWDLSGVVQVGDVTWKTSTRSGPVEYVGGIDPICSPELQDEPIIMKQIKSKRKIIVI